MLQHLRWIALVSLFVAAPSWASAEQLRYHYVPIDAAGTMTQVPAGPEGAMGELKRGVGFRPMPYRHVVRPTKMVTFRHPFNGKSVTVPVRLPEGPAKLETHRDRIVYNYGEYTVEARFNPDGSVDITYNSGLLRPLRFD